MPSTGRFKNDREARRALQENLQTLPKNRLDCRQYRHAWDADVDYLPHPVKGTSVVHVKLEMFCLRDCGVMLREIYQVTRSRGLERISRQTVYPTGYLFPGVPRGVKPLEIIQQERWRRRMMKVAGAPPGARETAEP